MFVVDVDPVDPVDPVDVDVGYAVPQEGGKYVYNPCPTFTTSLPENSKPNEWDSDDDFDIRDHLDTVPIPMPEPLHWQDYMYYPNQISMPWDA